MSTLLQELRVRVSKTRDGFPAIHSKVCCTGGGTPYLREPGVAMVGMPRVDITSLGAMLEGFDEVDPTLGFLDYLEDPVKLTPGAELAKAAGQICYASYGPGRTCNEDAERYFENILRSGHGSVLEHANYTLLIYGISRSLTHEKVRHRVGRAYSQLSQRYVSGRVLRFVERPEYASDPELHELFEARIDRAAKEYEDMSERLLGLQEEGDQILSGEQKTDRRKKVQQVARSLLPNETETIIVDTGNARAWRHYLEMRASEHAEVEIRAEAMRIYLCLVAVEPILFGDYEVVELGDGTLALDTKYRKV